MRYTVKLKQKIEKVGDGSYVVEITINNSTVSEFKYNNTNGIFPLYNSLINIIRGYEDVHVELETNNPIFAREVNGMPNKHTRLLGILNETKKIQRVTIDAITK